VVSVSDEEVALGYVMYSVLVARGVGM
jgi:hypothetical protein